MSFPLSSTAERVRERATPIRSRNKPMPTTREDRPALRLLATPPTTILIAGSDNVKRAALAQELAAELPANTHFDEARATWELLERAPSSRLVMLTGDLDGMSAEAAVQLLGRRHPTLAVLAVESRMSSPTALDSVAHKQGLQPSPDLACV